MTQTASKLATIRVVSFGYKYSQPPAANLVFDVRFCKNPHYDEALRPLTGKDASVQEFLLQEPDVRVLLDQLEMMLPVFLSGYLKHGNNHEEVVIAFGCTGGKHRSQFFALRAAGIITKFLERIAHSGNEVMVEHLHNGRE